MGCLCFENVKTKYKFQKFLKNLKIETFIEI